MLIATIFILISNFSYFLDVKQKIDLLFNTNIWLTFVGNINICNVVNDPTKLYYDFI